MDELTSEYVIITGGNLRCYVCGEPATYGRKMGTPSGGSYIRGWCTYHGPKGTGAPAMMRRLAVDVLSLSDGEDPRPNAERAGQRVKVAIEGTVLRVWPTHVEILVGGEGRLVASVPRSLVWPGPSDTGPSDDGLDDSALPRLP